MRQGPSQEKIDKVDQERGISTEVVHNSDHTIAGSLYQEKHFAAEARTSDLLFLEAADSRAAHLLDELRWVNLVYQLKEAKFSLSKRVVSIAGLQRTLHGTVHKITARAEVPLVLCVASGVHVFQGVEVDRGVCSEVDRQGAQLTKYKRRLTR